MDIGSLLLGLAFLLVVGFLVARPLFEQGAHTEPALTPLEQLLAARDQNLTALRDLDFDHTTGKITPEDYQVERLKLVNQGVLVLKQLDTMGYQNAPTAAPVEDAIEVAVAQRRKATPTASIDDAIEAAIAHKRAAAPTNGKRVASSNGAALTCPSCLARAQASDKFCPKCGFALQRVCTQCSHVAHPDDKFCAKCGKALPALVAA